MSSQKFLSPAWRNGKIRSPTIMILRVRSPIRFTTAMYLKSMHAGNFRRHDRLSGACATAFPRANRLDPHRNRNPGAES